MRLYNLLLHLYPASFRHEYGGEMRAVFARQRRDTRGLGIPRLWLATAGEVLANAALVHFDILRQDAGYTARVLRRSRGFAATVVLIVALGIGATTAAFSVTDFVLLRPLPFPEPQRLVELWERTPGYQMELSAPNYRDWKAAARSFESMGMYFNMQQTLTSSSEPRRLEGASVSADLFSTLGVVPFMGRAFTADDDRPGAAATVILSHRLWQTTFGGDPDIVGKSVPLDHVPCTIVGVMGRDFHFPTGNVLFWTTNRFGESDYQNEERTNNYLHSVARLRRGVTIEEARADMDNVAAASERQHPKENERTGAMVVALGQAVSERSRLLLTALSGAAGCVLLIACANLANMLLARALGRRRELAVRAAMGAGRERLVRQLLTESLLLAGAGGILGIGLAVIAVPLLAELVPATLPIAATPAVDLRVLLFAVALTIVTGVTFGLAPVLRAGRAQHLDGLREGPRAGGGDKERTRSALVVAEIMACVVLLVSAGLLIRALLAVRGIDPGFKADGVLTMRTELPMPEYRRVAEREAFYDRVLREVRALPGVTGAGYVSFLPISSFRGGIWPVSVKGDAEAANDTRTANNVASLRYVTPGDFAAMSIPLERGRDIAEGDIRERPFVAVVSRSFVKRYWPNEDPIGRHFTFAFADREVVGVVGDVRFRGLERSSEPQAYLSSKQVNDGDITFYAPKALAVRATVPTAGLVQPVRDVVRRADPSLPITEVRTLAEMIELDTGARAAQVRVLTVFATIAFVLAAVGIHGLLSFAVSQRVTEIGVRRALGAQSRDILWMVLSRGLTLAIAGVVPGLVLAYIGGRGMSALLAGIPVTDGPTIAGAVGLAVAMTVLGILQPTRRALRVDPIAALKAE